MTTVPPSPCESAGTGETTIRDHTCTQMGSPMAIGEAPVLETLADINAVSIARSEFDPATLILVRAAALVAVDAPRASYLMHIGAALESGVTVKDIQDVLVAVAPITGAPRVLT